MRTMLLIAYRELAAFFDSLMAYLVLLAFLGVCGFFTWWFGEDFLMRGIVDLSTFFNTAYWTLFFFIPALTMRTLAEERRTGTLDVLLAKAVATWQVVLGKALAAFALIAIALACTLPYWWSVASLGELDHGAVACGYFALLAMSAAYIAIGILASSLTTNQIVAFTVGLFLIALFHMGFSVVAANSTGPFGEVMDMLSTGTHFESMGRGVVDVRDLVYFGGITFLGLAWATQNLQHRDLRA